MSEITDGEAIFLVKSIDDYISYLEEEADSIESRPEMGNDKYADDDRWCDIQEAIMMYDIVKNKIKKQLE